MSGENNNVSNHAVFIKIPQLAAQNNIRLLYGYIQPQIDEYLSKVVKKAGIADWQKKDITFDNLAIPSKLSDIWSIESVTVTGEWVDAEKCVKVTVYFTRNEQQHSEYITKLYFKV